MDIRQWLSLMKAKELIGGDMKIGERYKLQHQKVFDEIPWLNIFRDYVGKVGQVIDLDGDDTGQLHFGNTRYLWCDESWLEKVEERKPEFNELIEISDTDGEWHNRHVAMILPDGEALCFWAGKKYPSERHAYIWDEWRLIDQPSDDEWCKYNF